MIRADRIDILVDPNMHMSRNRLLVFARKPAPVQVTWLGYPGSTGLATMDYRLTDPHLDPSGIGDQLYSEQLVRLPNSFWCYDPLTDQPEINPLPAQSSGHITFGCLNNFYKINIGAIELFAKVLHAVPGSRLLMLCPCESGRASALNHFQHLGIDPARIEFAGFRPRPEYLRTYHRIDISLDVLPYNGHTTSMDSLWMGVPIITLVGNTAAGRAGLSILTNLNMPDLIAQSPAEYVEIAVRLSSDLKRLADLRATLRERMTVSPFMDAPPFAGDIESAYRTMWQSWCFSSI
jgi:protein O-GlcNAc transferase